MSRRDNAAPAVPEQPSAEQKLIEKYYNQLPPLEYYDEEDTTLTQVQVDGLVVIKIMKHSREHFPEIVAGALLGLDIGSTLDVTNSFPFPKTVQQEGETQDSTPDEAFQMEMMRCLRDINVDNNIGWYR